MNEDKGCPFCGTEVEKRNRGWDKLICGSIRYNSDGTFETFYSRHIKCYEAEIANLKAQLREAEGLIRELLFWHGNQMIPWPEKRIEAFLTSTTPDSEMVLVRKQELALLLRKFQDGTEEEWVIHDRLKAALKGGKG